MNKIASQRKKIGVTQTKLAETLGWKPSRISNYELNIRTPSLNDCRLIAGAFKKLGVDCSIDDLFPHPKGPDHAA